MSDVQRPIDGMQPHSVEDRTYEVRIKFGDAEISIHQIRPEIRIKENPRSRISLF